jgi:hypothetical protein
MPIVNPVKGEYAVKTAHRTLLLCYTWPVQRMVGKHMAGLRFREVIPIIGELDDDQLSYVWWAGFQHHQPELDEAATDAVISEIGLPAAFEAIAVAAAGAFDVSPEMIQAAIAEAKGEPAGGAARPRSARRRPTTRTPASGSGASSASIPTPSGDAPPDIPPGSSSDA